MPVWTIASFGLARPPNSQWTPLAPSSTPALLSLVCLMHHIPVTTSASRAHVRYAASPCLGQPHLVTTGPSYLHADRLSQSTRISAAVSALSVVSLFLPLAIAREPSCTFFDDARRQRVSHTASPLLALDHSVAIVRGHSHNQLLCPRFNCLLRLNTMRLPDRRLSVAIW